MNDRRRLLLPGALLVAVALLIAVLVSTLGESPIDEELLRDAAAWRDGSFGSLLEAITRVGYGSYLVPAAFVAAAGLLARRRYGDAIAVALTSPLAVLVTTALKESFQRVRPEDGVDFLRAGYSLPSGHATSSFAFAVSLLLVVHRRRLRIALGGALLVLAALNALSRVVLGVHYPSDVIAGACLGSGLALVVAALVDRVVERASARAAG